MGMYTEFLLECKLDTSKMSGVDKNIIDYLFNKDDFDRDYPPELPNHKLFECPRWDMIGRSGSCYFDRDNPINENDLTSSIYTISSKSDFKCYNNEIKLFVEWITPFIIKSDDKPLEIGYEWYEEDEEPTKIFI